MVRQKLQNPSRVDPILRRRYVSTCSSSHEQATVPDAVEAAACSSPSSSSRTSSSTHPHSKHVDDESANNQQRLSHWRLISHASDEESSPPPAITSRRLAGGLFSSAADTAASTATPSPSSPSSPAKLDNRLDLLAVASSSNSRDDVDEDEFIDVEEADDGSHQQNQADTDDNANKSTVGGKAGGIACGVCGMAFRFPSKLRRHEKIHDSDLPREFPCDACPKAFRYAYHLRRHKWLIHAPDRPVFTCDVCFKSYKGEELFRLHRSMAHVSSSPAAAAAATEPAAIITSAQSVIAEPIKTLIAPTLSNSTDGSANSNNEKLFTCHVCGTNFKQKHYLTQHLMTHSKERPFVCEICNKGFARASTLFAHRYVHTVGRQFQCVNCKKAFKHKRSLTEHMKAKICSSSMAQGDARYSRTLTASVPRMSASSTSSSDDAKNNSGAKNSSNSSVSSQFVCEFCGDFFASVSYLYMHRRRCHRESLRGASSTSPGKIITVDHHAPTTQFGGRRSSNNVRTTPVIDANDPLSACATLAALHVPIAKPLAVPAEIVMPFIGSYQP